MSRSASEVSGSAAALEAAAAVRADRRPASVIPLTDGLIGLASLSFAWVLVVALKPDRLVAAWLLMLAAAVPMLVLELARSPATGGSGRGRLRPLPWFIGLAAATAPFLLIHGQGDGLDAWLVGWTVALPLFGLRLAGEAARNGIGSAEGFLATLGEAIIHRNWSALRILAPPARLWALKAFFVPLYGASLYALTGMALAAPEGPFGWLTLAVIYAYTIDLAFGLGGYVCAANSLVPTIRSTQPRLGGWIVCLLCYGPAFAHWPDFSAVVHSEIGWPQGLMATPGLLLAAAAMLVLLALYVSATVVFGLRFSNLSNRGVITRGPYRLMKHPAYFAHMGNAWIITLAFVPATGVGLGPSQLLVPVAFTILYRLRAVTEEQHLREDPDYVAYAEWISRHGLLARLRRLVRLAGRPG